MESAREIIRLEGITKRFGTLVANDAVDLVIRAGEIQALLGENGAGKSTLMKTLYGLLSPDSGTILIDGKPTRLPTPHAARAHGIGMVFQHFSLFEDFTALENIAVPLKGRIADAALAKAVREKADRFGLAIELDRPVYTLSAGERQRIEILRALMQEPRVLILDEPTSVLTPQEVEGLFRTVRILAAEGAGVLFISHKLEEVRALCSTATVLRGGRLIATADPRITSARDLATMMVGEGVADIRAEGRTPGAAHLVVQGLDVKASSIHGVELRAINLTVRMGEILGIAGVAGNGQSELFAALSGESGVVSAGSIQIAGEDLTQADISARRKAGAAFVPEQRLGQATLPDATLSQNIALSWHATENIGNLLLDQNRLEAVSRDVIKRFDVRTPSPDPLARQLSGGNLQKYVVGREVLRKPSLIIIDQPTWGVDARASAHIRQTLLDLAASGVAILVISQDLDEVFEISDRIAVMHHGHLTQGVSAKTVTRAEIGLMMTGQEAAA